MLIGGFRPLGNTKIKNIMSVADLTRNAAKKRIRADLAFEKSYTAQI
jgi:hypothetical protein